MVEVIYMDEATFGGTAQDRQRMRRWLDEGLNREAIEAELADLEAQRRAREAGLPPSTPADTSPAELPAQQLASDVNPDIHAALASVGQRKQRVRQRIESRVAAHRTPAPPPGKPPMHPDVPEELRDRWERAPYQPLPPATSPETGPVPFPMLDRPYRPSG